MCYVPTGTLRDSKRGVHFCQSESEPLVDWANLGKKAETFWDRLQEAFDQAKAPAIAKKLEIEKQAVYKWRNGNLPSLDTLIAISKATGCSLHWLVFGEGPKRITDAVVIPGLPARAKLSDHDRELVNSLITALKRGVEDVE